MRTLTKKRLGIVSKSHHVKDLRQRDADVDDNGSRSVDDRTNLAVVVLHQVSLNKQGQLSRVSD